MMAAGGPPGREVPQLVDEVQPIDAYVNAAGNRRILQDAPSGRRPDWPARGLTLPAAHPSPSRGTSANLVQLQ